MITVIREKNLRRERIKWIDMIKGICIIFVMVSHSYPPDSYRDFYTPFFLTMFFFAAGMTYRSKSVGVFLRDKVYQLIVPLFLLGLLRISFYAVLQMGDFMTLLKGLLLQINGKQDELWFISCLFSTYVLFYLLDVMSGKITKEKRDEFLLFSSVLIFLFGFADIRFLGVNFPWELELAGMMLLYMVLGYLYRKKAVRIGGMTAGITFLIYVLLLVFFDHGADIHNEQFPCPMLLFVESLLIICPIIYLTQHMEKYRQFSFLVFLGKNSLFYFAFSGFVREIYDKLRPHTIYTNREVEALCCTILMCVTLAVPAVVITRVAPFFVGKPKQKISVGKWKDKG